jgi:hypothetical protein
MMFQENEASDEVADRKDTLHWARVHMGKVAHHRGTESRYESDSEIADCPGDRRPGHPDFYCAGRIHCNVVPSAICDFASSCSLINAFNPVPFEV